MAVEGIALAAVISLASYFAEFLDGRIKKYQQNLRTLNAGILISVAALELLPVAMKTENGPLLFILGFAVFYLLEDYIYRATKPKRATHEIGLLHFIGFFSISFLFGMLLGTSLISSTLAIFLFVPLLIRKVSATLYATEAIKGLKLKFSKEILSFSTLFGALFASAIAPAYVPFILAFLTGSLLFLAGRDLVHPSRRDNPLIFILGILITLASYFLI